MSIEPEHDVFFVPQQFTTLQAAVNAVVRPTTIMVSPGSYPGARISAKSYLVIESSLLSRRGVTLTGSECEGVIVVQESTVHLSGIEIRSNGRSRGIRVTDSSLSLQECVVAGNRVDDECEEPAGAGILCRRSAVRLQKSVIAGNTIQGRAGVHAYGGGLFFDDCRVEIAGCTVQINAIYEGEEARGGGVYAAQSRMRIWKSRITDNAIDSPAGRGGGVFFAGPSDTQIGGSVITGNTAAHGGGIAASEGSERVHIHRGTVVRQNCPDDVDMP